MAAKKSNKPKTAEVCPVCGEDVPANAVACPECGADHKSGWAGHADAYDGVDLPDEHFDYEEFVKQEFGSSPKGPFIKPIWWITAVILIVALIVIYYARR